MGVPRGTTPTFTLTFNDEALDLTTATGVYVTFNDNGNIITKTGDAMTVGAKQIEVYLTQKETLSFSVGAVEVQANWTYSDGKRAASKVATVNITKQLLDEVI
ncbi:MAG: hypothetical protein II777_10615 [Clostridia bacterium]|nr:hypothetical protein [Clostridia bacterium]